LIDIPNGGNDGGGPETFLVAIFGFSTLGTSFFITG
jgi:hypothetical protein